MTETEFNALLRGLGMSYRREVVASLLAGNDAQCFTTQQYAEAYHRLVHQDDPNHREGWIKWLMELAPTHLRSVGLVEVQPEVWRPGPFFTYFQEQGALP